MLLEYLLMPRAGDLTDPADVDASYSWVVTDDVLFPDWQLEEDP